MPWIETVPFEEATGKLRKLYDRVAGPEGNVDNIMMVHGLRPHSMEGHMALYKNVLHHTGNTLPKWVLEMLGVWVSALNGCAYCVEHHFAGLTRLMQDDDRAAAIRAAIEARDVEALPVREAERAAMVYAHKLTERPAAMEINDVWALKDAGLSDGEILEINQVVAYFAYANRTVLGLGCSTEGDVLGLSPGNSEDPQDWGHR
ncbi:peroxidase-related enzyme [Epibacterium sp. MM17-32]|uniref:peroxidase-related enzyme n=1 Tax=Epibacterium sp. MM17-32 TaxID=2917734 RepID=UPI001EF6EBC5|nr:peroxidase-related enzyme [Epibacterium sp. MM17-32]MCG7627389.1 peroxidase-related enzyme [Epibacterium sp. MM17-32]